MKINFSYRIRVYSSVFLRFFCFFAILSLLTSPVYSVDFEKGDLYGSWDTTFSYGQTHRVQSRDRGLIGVVNGGTAFSINGDDGNLNYDTGLVSSALKFTTELELNYKNYGAFFRGTGFRDFLNDDPNDTIRTPLSNEAIELVGKDLKLLDAYAWANFDLGDKPFELRVGEQVISWGESTFIQNGINVINPVDVSKLRVPGAELKEALLPVGIVSASLGVTENVSLEAYYQYDYERILIDPPGSYFSTNDFVGNGGIQALIGFGLPPTFDYFPIGGVLVPAVALGVPFAAPRAPDDRPDQGEEYGVALRVYAPTLNDTEFGFYHIKYHSRLPVINAIATTTITDASDAFYQIAYPEDIKLYGISFNTQLGTSGWALQGEYSFRDDAPLQIDDNELLIAALFLGVVPNQVGAPAPGTLVPGFIRRDVSQFQATATRVFGPTFKADQAVLLGEFAVTHVHDMPDKDILSLEAPGTPIPGSFLGLDRTGAALLGSQPNDDFADATSWGYRIVGMLDYNNVIGAINLQPSVSWRHDVHGITPGPGGNFVEDQKAVTLGLRATYQNEWEAEFSYTSLFGGGTQNLLNDRDFTAFSISYSF